MKCKYMTGSICIGIAVILVGLLIYMKYLYVRQHQEVKKCGLMHGASEYLYSYLSQKFKMSINTDRMERLCKVNVGMDTKEIQKKYYTNFILIFFYILLGIFILVPLAILSSEAKQVIYSNYFIEKADIGGGEKEVNIKTKIDNTEKEVKVNVPARIYSDEELKEKVKEAKKYIDNNYLGDNASAENINKNLNLVSSIPHNAIEITWLGDSQGYIDSNGTIHTEDIEKARNVEINATLKYGEYEKNIVYELTLIPPDKSNIDIIWNKWKKSLSELSKMTADKNYMELPSEVQGYKVSYKEVEDNSYIYIFFCGVLFIIMFPFVMDSRTKSAIEKRDRELKNEYPELIEKFILLIGAGLNIKGAWYRITNEYIAKKEKDNIYSYTYEEMLVTRYQIENGMAEVKAYEFFGRRIGLLPYMKFSTLLTQNLRKGASDMLQILEYEASDIINEKKENVKILGEEASTKLLMPMMIMMVEVFAIIIYAAFQSM